MFRPIDIVCPNCHYHEERVLDLRGGVSKDEAMANEDFVCPSCSDEYMKEVWIHAPAGKMENDQHPKNIERMKQSFRDRFVKTEINDVRHKHGRLFDDSLRSAAVQRIKKEEGLT